MNLKKQKKYLMNLIILVVIFYPISLVNFLLFHTLIEVTIIILVMTTTIIGINTYDLTKNNVIIILGYGFFGFSAFTLLHILSYEGMNILNLGEFFYIKAYAVADLIFGVSFFIAIKNIDNKINEDTKTKAKARIMKYIYFIILIAIFFLISKENIFKLSDEIISKVIFGKIIEAVVLILVTYILIILGKKKKKIGEDRFEGLRIAFISILITMVISLFYKTSTDIPHIIAHIFKLLSIYYIYKSIILETLTNPMGDMFSRLNQLQKKILFENIKLEDELKLEKRTEEKLKKYKMSMEQSMSLIKIFNREGKIDYVNQKVLDITLFNRNELLNKGVKELDILKGLSGENILQKKWKKKRNGLENYVI